jgi:hypothetical protein
VFRLDFFDFFREPKFLTLGLNAQQGEDSVVLKLIENLRVLDVLLCKLWYVFLEAKRL